MKFISGVHHQTLKTHILPGKVDHTTTELTQPFMYFVWQTGLQYRTLKIWHSDVRRWQYGRCTNTPWRILMLHAKHEELLGSRGWSWVTWTWTRRIRWRRCSRNRSHVLPFSELTNWSLSTSLQSHLELHCVKVSESHYKWQQLTCSLISSMMTINWLVSR